MSCDYKVHVNIVNMLCHDPMSNTPDDPVALHASCSASIHDAEVGTTTWAW
jgi:hypothetical protein